MSKIILHVAAAIILSSCASRGYRISQQIPHVDNKMESIPKTVTYKVDAQGEIIDLKETANTENNRSIAASTFNEESLKATRFLASVARVESTLDPVNGAAYLGKSTVKVKVKPTREVPIQETP